MMEEMKFLVKSINNINIAMSHSNTDRVVLGATSVNDEVYELSYDPGSNTACTSIPFTSPGEASATIAARSVGRLVLPFEHRPSQTRKSCLATAFAVAKIPPNIVIMQTARHNLLPVHDVVNNEEQIIHPNNERFVCFAWSKIVQRPDTAAAFHPVTVLAYPDPEPNYADHDPISGKPLPSNYPDVAFLRATINDLNTFNRIIPLLPAHPLNIPDIAVLGWGAVTSALEACPQLNLLPSTDLRRTMVNDKWVSNHFGKQLTLSLGKSGQQIGPVATHTASVTHGTSGGPVVSLITPGIYFGVHVGGAPTAGETDFSKANHNVFVTVQHPVFITLYKEHVLPHIYANLEQLPQTACEYFQEFCELELQ